MKRHILILSLFLTTIFTSCSDNENKEEFKEAQKSFLASMETFGKANESATKLFEDLKTGLLGNEGQVISQIKKGITESETVTDDYLDFIHPQLKSMYRDNLVGSYKLLIENIDNRDLQKANELDIQLNEKQQAFWAFMQANQDDLNVKMKQVNKKTFGQKIKRLITADESKKSYWRMFVRLIISDFLSIFVFSFFLIALLLPLAPIGLLAEKLNNGLLTILSIPFMIIAGIGQAYFWVLWAAYCAYTIQFYMDSPTVSHNWLYYITGFFSVTGPIGWLSHKERQSATSYEEQKKIQGGTTYYSLIAIVAFIVFCVWTNLLDYKYISWLNDWLY